MKILEQKKNEKNKVVNSISKKQKKSLFFIFTIEIHLNKCLIYFNNYNLTENFV